jgi:hypothetical protein
MLHYYVNEQWRPNYNSLFTINVACEQKTKLRFWNLLIINKNKNNNKNNKNKNKNIWNYCHYFFQKLI